MLSVLDITFPIFAAIAIGFFLRAIQVFRAEDIEALSRYVFNVAFPALLFSVVAGRDLGEVLDAGYIAAVASAGLMSGIIVYFGLRLTGADRIRRSLAAMAAGTPNSAFVGYPILLLALPSAANEVLVMNFVCECFFVLPFGQFLLQTARSESGASFRTFLTILYNILRVPFVVALIAGVAVSLIGLPVPEPVLRLSTILGGAASATALIVSGGVLYGLPTSGNRLMAGTSAAAKLILHPALAFLFVTLLASTSLGITSPEIRTAATLSAAMPVFSTFVILAGPYGRGGQASLTVLLSMFGAFFTISG